MKYHPDTFVGLGGKNLWSGQDVNGQCDSYIPLNFVCGGMIKFDKEIQRIVVTGEENKFIAAYHYESRQIMKY